MGSSLKSKYCQAADTFLIRDRYNRCICVLQVILHFALKKSGLRFFSCVAFASFYRNRFGRRSNLLHLSVFPLVIPSAKQFRKNDIIFVFCLQAYCKKSFIYFLFSISELKNHILCPNQQKIYRNSPAILHPVLLWNIRSSHHL